MLSGNSLRQTVHTHRASVHQAAKLAAALLRVARVTAGLAESNDSLYIAVFMTHVTGRLTGKNRDQLRNPTLGIFHTNQNTYGVRQKIDASRRVLSQVGIRPFGKSVRWSSHRQRVPKKIAYSFHSFVHTSSDTGGWTRKHTCANNL